MNVKKKYPAKLSAFLFIALFSLLTGCNYSKKQPSPYPGYTAIGNTTYYKYCDMGSSGKPAMDSEKLKFMETIISISKLNDSVFWLPPATSTGYPFYYYFTYSVLNDGETFEKHLLHAVQGDSILYLVSADSLFKYFFHLPLPIFLNTGNMVKVHVRVRGIMDSSHDAAKIKIIKQYRKNMDMQEQLNLLHYVTSHNIPDSAREGGIYFLRLVTGTGPKIKAGSMVSLSYNGYFLNGRLFDSLSPENPMQFRYGDKEQVVKGLEIALKMMREGEESKIIIPSQLAFGEKGSLTGVVPPYSTLIYKVKILQVKN